MTILRFRSQLHRTRLHFSSIAIVAAGFAVGVVCLTTTATAAQDKDNFKCRLVVVDADGDALPSGPVQLSDAIEDKLTEVAKRTRVCDGASIDAEPLIDPVANWTCYGIKQAKDEAKFVRRDIHVKDRFGNLKLSLVKASQMCVTSERDSAGVPAPIDDLKCYGVKIATNEGHFAASDVVMVDEFDGARTTIVKKPKKICGPVDRDGSGVVDPGDHWMCYQIADAKTVPPQPKSVNVDVTVANLFEGPEPIAMTVKKPREVCVPASAHLEGANGVAGAQFCEVNLDCNAGLYCARSGVCAPAGTGAVGDACVSGGDCDDALACDLRGLPGSCTLAGGGDTGAPCTSIGDCAAGLACSPLGACQPPEAAYPDYPGVSCDTDESAFTAYFEVPRPGLPPRDFFRMPFPNDARVRADGTLDMTDFPRPGPSILGVDLIDLYADALNEDFDGFSSMQAVTFRMSKELDFDTIGDGTGYIHFVDITPGALEFGTERPYTLDYEEGRGLYRCQNTLVVRDAGADPLLPGHSYAVYVTNGIESVQGDVPVQDADFTAVMSSAPPADADLMLAWTSYQDLRDYLASQSIPAATLSIAIPFKLFDSSSDPVSLRTALESLPLPVLSDLTLCDGVAVSPCNDGGVGACGAVNADFHEIHGRMSVPVYQQGTVPYETPADGGGLVFDAGGVPVQQGSAEVCFALTVPKSAAPGSGWPLVVHAHGTGGSFRSGITDGIAPTLSTAGTPMATLTFDGIAHGERRGASTRNPDSLVFNVVNPRATRDNHLQGGVDVMQALRVAQTTPTVGPVVVTFDANRTYFFGHSQGSNVGIPALAVSDLPKAAVLSGGGGLLIEGLMSKTSPVNIPDGMQSAIGEPLTNGHPMMQLMQVFAGRSDPINYSPLMLRRPPSGSSSKHVFMSWGTNDTYTPTASLNAMARAIGLPVASPVLEDIGTGTAVRPISNNIANPDGSSSTAALFQYAPDAGHDGHFVALESPAAVADWTAFLSSAAASGTPTVP